MKKFYSLCFAALCAAAIVSCTKETITENPSNEEPAPVAQTILNPVTLTFEANASSKVAIDGEGKASWEEGDQVRIICFNAKGESWTSGAITVVGGKISATVEDADTYYAVYPASAAIALAKVGEVDNLTVTIPTEQDGTFKNACYYAAKTSSTDKCFNFKAVSGIIKFEAATDYVRADIATVESQETLQALAGDATCTFNEDGTVNVSAPSSKGNTTMTFVTLDKSGTYYIAIPGNATNELAFRFKKEGEDADYEPGVYFNNRITYEPAKIKNFGNVTDRIVSHVYVSPNGTGNGLSAEAPAAVADLNEACLGDTEVKYTAVKGLLKYSGSWNCFRRHGLTIHFAEGEYNDAFTVAGNNSSFCLTLEGTSGAVLKGGLTVSATRVKTDDHEATVTTVKNLTFTAATGLTIATGLCNVEGCTFTGCTTRAAALGKANSSGKTDGSTDVNLNVNFKNCLFSANTVGSQGAVKITDGATGGIVGFHNCRFENNVAASGNASAIYAGGTKDANSKTAIFLNKCSFIGNTCTTKANAYTIGTNSADARFGMNCCTVNAGGQDKTNFPAYNNGAALTLKGQSVIANSTVWTSTYFGKWGLVALGCATSSEKTNGAAIINSVVRQKETTYPAVYLHTNYYQTLNYCLHSGKDLTVESGKHTVANSAKVSAFANAAAKTKDVDGITAYYYTWNFATTTSGLTFSKPSKETVENAIKAVGESTTGAADGLGNLFLTWLNTVDETALTKDLIGADRPEAGICPGSVEQAQ